MKFFKVALFSLFFCSVMFCCFFCKSNNSSRFVVVCPSRSDSVETIKGYINSVHSSDKRILDLFQRLKCEIFKEALENLGLEECNVQPMFIWMNFCEGLKENMGSTALTHGYYNKDGYHIVFLADSKFMFSSDAVVGELIAHEMIHAYCDHMNLDSGADFHQGWFDKIAAEIERLSGTYSDPLYALMGNLYRR